MWWKESVIYQIYVRSFCDSNGDGIGDLQGIISRLDYLKNLGVDAVWLTPFYRSPGKDFGYDIDNYREVDPIFGSIEDFKELLNRARQNGLKVIIDMAFSHSSDQCLYFQESRRSKNNTYSDWYVWADPLSDGSPPNNWQSIFGGSAWTYEPRRRQYYLHNFLKEQPDFNFHNPAVQEETLSVMKHWLDLGVDGFRLDVCNFYFHDISLKSNPPRPVDGRPTGGSFLNSPYQYQLHIYDKDQPENLLFIKRMRDLVDQYSNRFLMAEIGSDNQLKLINEYTAENNLHSAYSFELLVDHFSPHELARACHQLKNNHPSWSFSNHDVKRVATRWAENDLDKAKTFFVLLLALKGTPILYQGEECGFTESELNLEDIVDPYGLAFYPEFKGRDGCRTPMTWDHSTPDLWLPIDKNHLRRNVAQQVQSPDSFFSFAKTWLAFRKQHRELLSTGEIDVKLKEFCFEISRSNNHSRIEFVFANDLKGFSVTTPTNSPL